MLHSEDIKDLKSKIEAVGARIEEQKKRFQGTAVPFGETEWKDIVANHAELARKIDEERGHDASVITRLRGELHTLALSFDSWLKGIDGYYARQQRNKQQ